MRKNLILIVASALILCSSPLQALEFGGINFPDKIALPDTNKTVQLNGVGYRKKFFVFVCHIFTNSKSSMKEFKPGCPDTRN